MSRVSRNGFSRARLALACWIFGAAQALGQGAAPQPPADDASATLAGTSSVEEITVTGSRTGAPIAELATSVDLVDERELGQQFALSRNLLRALDVSVPGLNVSTSSRTQCLTNIRGRTPSFQINGVPANQELRPSNCNSAFQVSPFALERIEVVRGATALFGAGAPGGIINLITRRAAAEQLEVDALFQTSFDTNRPSGTFQHDVYVGAGRRQGAFDYYGGIAYQNYDGARDPEGRRLPATEFRSVSLNGSFGWEPTQDLRLRFTGTWYGEDPGQEWALDGAQVDAGVARPDVIAVEPNPFREESLDRLYTLALSLEADDVLGQRVFLSGFHQAQEFRQRANFQDFNAGLPDFFSDDRENSSSGMRLTLARDAEVLGNELGLEYGLDYQRNRFLRLLLDPTEPDIVTGFIAPEVVLNIIGVFGQATVDFGRLSFSGGVRRELYRGHIGDDYANQGLPGTGSPGDFRDEALWLGNFGVVVDVNDAMQFFAGYNEGAEITQLGRAARNAADASLISPEPAKSRQYEAGVRGARGPLDFTLAGFYSESDAASLVQPDPSCAGQSFCPLIPLRAPQRVHGLEATLDWKLHERAGAGVVFTWQRGEIYDDDFGRFIEFGADTVSPTRFTAFLDAEPLERVRARLQVTHAAATDFFTPGEQGLGFINTRPATFVDLSVAVDVGPGELNLGASNLLGAKYRNPTEVAGGFLAILDEGRRLTLGYDVRF
jgi:iron complex outermembrane receptor protein